MDGVIPWVNNCRVASLSLGFYWDFRWAYNQPQYTINQYPSVSIVITCYGEGDAIGVTIDTLAEQLYPGSIEILAVVDGAVQNKATYLAALHGERKYKGLKNRKVRVVPKWQRGGQYQLSMPDSRLPPVTLS